MMMRLFSLREETPTTTRGVDKNQHTQQHSLGTKKKLVLFLFSPKYISPKDPLPIFRPTRYLFPMRSSMPLEVILLLYFLCVRFCCVKARVESDEERERERTDQEGVEFFLLSFVI
jgi:hypothetical protein